MYIQVKVCNKQKITEFFHLSIEKIFWNTTIQMETWFSLKNNPKRSVNTPGNLSPFTNNVRKLGLF